MKMLLFVFVFCFVCGGVLSAPPDSTKTLPRATPESQGISSAAILSFIEAADSTIDQMNSFMLVRHGKVVAEGWWGPYNPESPHTLYSLSKSFTSTAVGMAISEGKFNLSDPVLSFFPEDAPADPGANLKAMRVSDLLMMSTGHQTEAQMNMDVPWTKTFLAHEVPHRPGTHFLYNTPATYMLSAIVQKTTGMTVLDYLRPRLFEPLGIDNPTWGTSPQGISLGGYGLNIRTEDIARFGQLYLQKGTWNGKQLVPVSWVEEATSRRTSNGSDPNSDWNQGYGYQFWRCRHNAYRGDGAFGQYCMVLPEQDAVVAITSGVRDMQAVMNLVWDILLPAMKQSPASDDPAGVEKLKTKLAGLTVRPAAGNPTSKLASRVSGKTYTFPENDRGIRSVQFNFKGKEPLMVLQSAAGESRITLGNGAWKTGSYPFTNGLDGRALAPGEHPVGASGAWTADDTYTAKLVMYETPYYTLLNFKFDGDRIVFDSEYNVNFGSPKLPQLIGQVQKGK